MKETAQFKTFTDKWGNSYFSVNFGSLDTNLQPRQATSTDFATFLAKDMTVSRRVTGIFSSDLTSVDDFLLATLSLILLLVIESIFSTILLRTIRGSVSNSGFSVKQFVDMSRDFRLRYLVTGRGRGREPKLVLTKINFRLLTAALIFLASNLVLEGTILYLISPEMVRVTNDIVSYTLVDVVMPNWEQIQTASSLATLQPCTKIVMRGVIQGNNQLSLCMVSNKTGTFMGPFELSPEEVRMTITSDIHDFGVEHMVTIGNLSAKYIGRGYFTLGNINLINKGNRFLRERESIEREVAVALVHKQLLAFLFSQHRSRTKNSSMTIESLEALHFDFVIGTGDPVKIIKSGNKTRFREVLPARYITTVTGIIPNGAEALRFTHAFLKGATGVALTGPDMKDLQVETGNTVEVKGWLWTESSRKLNLLSLSIFLCAACFILFSLRHFLVPVSTADIAAELVTREVGAEPRRSPILLRSAEKTYFTLPNFYR